ncbi:MAG: SDR family oxidoreductase, partial [Planctomycetes bacterium]|nr:SDR family oxidoreductase [Planctomycetota bacterium]
NNAGRPQRATPIISTTEEEWDAVYSVNVKGIFLGTKYAVPEMVKRGGGVIINTASISGARPRGSQAAYASSKGAAIVLTKSMALELARHNIRVNAVLPGTVPTDINRDVLAGEGVRDAIVDATPLKSLGTCQDVAGAVLYLAGDEARWITGSLLVVDGGFIA